MTCCMLQWGRNILVAESCARRPPCPCIRRFNGAATYSLRKDEILEIDTFGQFALQWGRNILVAESGQHALVAQYAVELQWGRNILVAESPISSTEPSYVHSLQWGRNILVAESRLWYHPLRSIHGASMGPQHTRCGKGVCDSCRPEKNRLLQWGRNILVAESSFPVSKSSQPLRLQWGRNILVAESWPSR